MTVMKPPDCESISQRRLKAHKNPENVLPFASLMHAMITIMLVLGKK